MAKYKAWSERMAAAGRLAGGEKLCDGEGRLLRKKGSGVQVTEGPYAEAKEVVAGFFVIQAESYDEAVALASECPHLEFGTVEVRAIDVV